MFLLERTEHLKLFAENGVPEWFGADLLEEDFDSVAWNWEQALHPGAGIVAGGIKSNVRGPFQMTPDELPLMGPAWGLENVWLAEGVPGRHPVGRRAGLLPVRADRRGRQQPRHFRTRSASTLAAMPTRNGPATRFAKAWGTHAELHFPGQDMPAARPQKTAPSPMTR